MNTNADGGQYVFQLKKPDVIANDASSSPIKRNVKGDNPVPPERGTSIESLPLSNCHNLQWVTDIAIGTPFPQIFTVAIDVSVLLLLYGVLFFFSVLFCRSTFNFIIDCNPSSLGPISGLR